MQMHAALDLEDFPDSPYARELRRDFPDLRFSRELEKEFQTFHLERMRARVRFCQLAICALAILSALQRVLFEGLPPLDLLFSWTGVVVPASLFLVWASWGAHYELIYLPAARLAVPACAVAAAIGVANHTQGHADQFYFLTTYTIALFFLGGQLFRESLLATGTVIIAHGTALAYLGESPASIAYFTTALSITGAAGAVVYRGVERQLRASFLERALMGEMVARDGLTGLKNRGAFEDDFPRMWQQALRDRRSLALMLIDVDHFKAYNDRYGHQAGDRALRRVAQVVNNFARRPLDIAARYGGEEFVLALFDMSGAHVREMADQLRRGIADLEVRHEGSPTAPVVTASIGVAVVGPWTGKSPEGVVQTADEALYEAKRSGRNAVRVVDCDMPAVATDTLRLSA